MVQHVPPKFRELQMSRTIQDLITKKRKAFSKYNSDAVLEEYRKCKREL